MIFSETKIKGAFIIDPELISDERGFFTRTFCIEEFERHGLDSSIVQCNISFNKKKGTLRGMHYQVRPFEEAKIVSCTKGAIYDVVVDLRRDSPTYKKWVAAELSEKNFKMVYIPRGCAHGFQTLDDNSIVYYQMTEYFHPECARGLRWDDPSIEIVWPVPEKNMSEKDKNYQDFKV